MNETMAATDRPKRKHFTKAEAVLVYSRAGGVCGICEEACLPADMSIDHIRPLAAGGPHEPDNWQLAHRWCNSMKRERLDYVAPGRRARQVQAQRAENARLEAQVMALRAEAVQLRAALEDIHREKMQIIDEMLHLHGLEPLPRLG